MDSKRGGKFSVWQLILRGFAAAGTLAAAIVMGTNKQSVVVLHAKYNYSPAFTYFVVANAIACAYSVLSLPAASYTLCRGGGRFVVATLDLIILVLISTAASAATAIAYVGHKGNTHTQWMAICNVFGRFCDHVGGALIASFISMLFFIALSLITLHHFHKNSNV